MRNPLVILGFVVAPAVPALISGLYSAPALILFLYTYPVELLVGVPAFLIFEWLGLRELRHYLLGSVFGVLLVTFLFLMGDEDATVGSTLLLSAVVGILGMSSAATFWLIAIPLTREGRYGEQPNAV